MAVNKNFVVKNGLEVAENLIFADSDKVGIGSTSPLAKLDVKGNINATDVFSSGVTTVATAFNVGTGVNYSVNQIADFVGGPRVTIPPRPGEARITLANMDKFEKLFGFKPESKLKEYIESVI